MTKNKEIAEMIFDKIKSFGFKPYKIEYGNGYFIFDRGEDSVIHFRIKGCKHWKFGLWINSDYLLEENKQPEDTRWDQLYKVVQLFTQYDTCIDKFKPSASTHCVEYNTHEWDSTLSAPYNFHQVKSMIGHIKRHPFISYYGDSGYDKSYLWYFIKNETEYKIYNVKKYIKEQSDLRWNQFKVFFAKHNKHIDTLTIIDKNTKDWNVSPRYDIDCKFTKDATSEQECKFLDFWFRKDYYENLSLRIHKVDKDGYYCYTRE